MTLSVMAVVLAAAAMHAGWNALVKSGNDKLAEITLVTSAAGLIAALALPFLPSPAAESWPYLAGSVLIHTGYFALVGLAYSAGDMSIAYPLMRGTAPLLTAVLSFALVGERLSAAGWTATGLLCAGVLVLAGESWRFRQPQGRAFWFASINACVVACYTLVDGMGVRLAGNAWSYVAWMFSLHALPLLGIMLAARQQAVATTFRMRWRQGLAGGALTLASYGLVLWAFTVAPIALVAALRETAVVFGVILAATLLGERFGAARWTACLLVASGAAVMEIL